MKMLILMKVRQIFEELLQYPNKVIISRNQISSKKKSEAMKPSFISYNA